MNYLQKFLGYFSKERVLSISSTTILVLASVFDFPILIVWMVAVVAWLGLSSLGLFFGGLILISVVRPITTTKFLVSVAESEWTRSQDVFAQILDNVPPIVSTCAWISLSWHVTAVSVFCAWAGVKYLQYRARQVTSRLSDEALLKLFED